MGEQISPSREQPSACARLAEAQPRRQSATATRAPLRRQDSWSVARLGAASRRPQHGRCGRQREQPAPREHRCACACTAAGGGAMYPISEPCTLSRDHCGGHLMHRSKRAGQLHHARHDGGVPSLLCWRELRQAPRAHVMYPTCIGSCHVPYRVMYPIGSCILSGHVMYPIGGRLRRHARHVYAPTRIRGGR